MCPAIGAPPAAALALACQAGAAYWSPAPGSGLIPASWAGIVTGVVGVAGVAPFEGPLPPDTTATVPPATTASVAATRSGLRILRHVDGAAGPAAGAGASVTDVFSVMLTVRTSG